MHAKGWKGYSNGFKRPTTSPNASFKRQRLYDDESSREDLEESYSSAALSAGGVEPVESHVVDSPGPFERGYGVVTKEESQQVYGLRSRIPVRYVDEVESNPDIEIYCTVCGLAGDPAYLFQCSLCASWIDLTCYNMRFGKTLQSVPEGDIFCTSLRSCSKIYNELLARGDIYEEVEDNGEGVEDSEVENSEYESSEVEDDSSSSLEGYGMDLDQTLLSKLSSSDLEEIVRSLYNISNTKPITYASVKCWAKKLVSLDPELYDDIATAILAKLQQDEANSFSLENIEGIKSSAPPGNIRRVLDLCGDSGILRENLVTEISKFDAIVKCTLWYRHPVRAAFDMHCARLARFCGPYRSCQDDRCSTGRLPDLKPRLQNFADNIGFDLSDPSNVTIPIGLYMDDSISASGNIEFCPLWQVDLNMDPAVRVIEKAYAQTLLSLMPVVSALEITDGKGGKFRQSTYLMRKNLQSIVQSFRASALEIILGKIAESEVDGLSFQMHGRRVNVRVMIIWFSADMKERRAILSLRKNAYHCSHCYEFPGKMVTSGLKTVSRSTKNDEGFRQEFFEGSTATSKEDQEKEFIAGYGNCGITLHDLCPFTRREACKVFMQDGPYELFPFDALHCKDGVINYYVDFLAEFIGKDFISQSLQFGNEFLDTKRFAMHVMEKGIQSFHFIPITIMLGTFKRELTSSIRQTLFLGACDLLNILRFMTDPCPAFVRERLQSSIKSFERHVEWLLGQDHASKHKITPKMHELFMHASADIDRFGLSNSFSTKLFETLHQTVKELFIISSKRREDGSASKEIILSMLYKQAVFEVEQLRGSSHRESGTFAEIPVFKVANADRKLPDEELFRRNAEAVASSVFGHNYADLFDEDERVPPGMIGLGSTLRMWKECSKRGCRITNVSTAVVPGTGKGMFTSGGVCNAIVYVSHDDSSDHRIFETCSMPDCRSSHHLRNVHLFSSAVRDGDSCFGIPVLFCNTGVVLLPLAKVAQRKSSIPMHEAMFETCCGRSCIFVEFSSVKGICMFRPLEVSSTNEYRGYIFPGQNVFGHDTHLF